MHARSPYRYYAPYTPNVTVRWEGEKKSFTVFDYHYRQHPLFTFGTKDILDDLLPDQISYVNDQNKTVSNQNITRLIDQAIKEIKKKKRRIKHAKQTKEFDILQDKNFSYRRGCGLLVMKFKNYPFVVKLFIERPETFLKYQIKGMEPVFFHFMTGGVNRHISGLTRIKNLRLMQSEIAKLEQWKNIIDFPRKWYWLPKDSKDIELIGKDIVPQRTIATSIPGTYAIIADAIDTNHQVDMSIAKMKKIIIQFSNDTYTYLDPHFDNFIFYKDKTSQNPYKIVIVDTEHFPTLVGIEAAVRFKNHHGWYMNLAKKCTHDMYFKTKLDLRNDRTMKSPLALDEPIFNLFKEL